MVKLLLYSLEGTAAFVRPCNVIDDVVKLAYCTLLALNLKGVLIRDLAELLL